MGFVRRLAIADGTFGDVKAGWNRDHHSSADVGRKIGAAYRCPRGGQLTNPVPAPDGSTRLRTAAR